MNDRNDSAHLCSPGTDRGLLPRAARRRALRAMRRRRRGASRPVRYGLLGAAAFCAVAGAAEPVYAQRGMSGVDVSSIVSGDVTFRRTRGGLTINASDGAIIEFDRFSIPKNQLVRFSQPGTSASVLSRVVGPEASLIQGTLLANGKVFLVNPSGVTFGPGARVNVGALYAAAGQLSNADFRRGVHNFAGLTGAVVNEGSIRAEAGVHLAGATVENAGSIVSSRGVVSLAAGDNVFVAERGSAVLVRIDGPGFVADATPVPPADGVGVRNTGSIEGAEVLVSAGDLHSLAIRNDGVITSAGGKVTLDGAGKTTNAGVIDASDRSDGGVGGEVRLLGEHVVQKGVIDASGDRAGGTIMVGGAFRGQGPERNAATTIITGDSVLRADALTIGDGGEIAIWGTDGAYVAGEISTRQGAMGGAGGFVEASADALLLRASVNAGVGGSFLIDPVDLTIDNGNAADPLPESDDFTFDGMTSSITNGSIEAVLNSGSSLVLEAQNDIFVTANIDSSGGGADGNLTLRAGRSIDVSNNTQITTDADITLQANFYEDGASATNDIIAGGRMAGDAQILLANQVDITAGGALNIEVRADATPLGADGMPVATTFAVGDISLGGAANDAQRVDLAGQTVVVTTPKGLIANADITATGSVLLHGGADGMGGTVAFAAPANQVTIDSPTTTLRAGDGSGGATIDLGTNGPTLTNATSFTVRQDGAVADAMGLLASANINGGSTADLAYTIQSDNGSITLDGFADLLDADLTLRTAGTVDFTAASDLGDVLITGLDANERAGAVTITQAVDLAGGSLEVESTDFAVSGVGTTIASDGAVTIDASNGVSIDAALTGGAVSIESAGAVGVNQAVSGDTVSIASTTAATTVNSNVTGSTSVSLAGETGLTVGPGVSLEAPSVALRATGAGATVAFDPTAVVVGPGGLVGVTDFTYALADTITNAELLPGAIFGVAAPTNYTIESGGAITLNDATPVNNTNLTLNAGGAVSLDGPTIYALNGLAVDAGGLVSAAAPIDITGDASVTANTGVADALAINLQDFDVTGSLRLNTDAVAAVNSPSGGYTLGASNIGEAVSITANGAVTGADLFQVGTGATGAGDVTLIDATSVNLTALDSAVPVTLNVANDVTIVSPNALTIDSSTIGGGLTATAQAGSLTLQNSVDVTNAASLTALGANSDIVADAGQLLTTTDVSLTAGRDVAIERAGGGSLALDAGRDATVTLTGTGQTEILASTIGNDLSLTSDEKVFSTALVDVGRNASIDAETADAVPIAIDFGMLDVGADGVLTLNTTGVAIASTASADGYELGASTVGVALLLSAANGEIVGDQKITVGNGALIPGAVTSLDAERVDLTDLNSLVPIALNLTDSGASSTIVNDGAIALAGVSVTGDLTATAESGAVTDASSATIDGDAVFTGDQITLDQISVGGQTSLVSAGAVTFATSQAADILALTAGGDVLLEAPDLTISGPVAAGGAGVDLTIRPSAADLSVGLGDGGAAAGQEFTLSASDLGNLADGFQSITIGRSDAFTDTLVLGAGVAFADPVTIRRPTDGVSGTTINNGLSGTDDASLTLVGAALGALDINGAITTEGGAIALNDSFSLLGDVTLSTAQGGAGGGNINAGAIGASVPGVGNVVVDAGTTGVVTLGDLGAGGATLQSFDLQGAASATLGLVNAAGPISLTANSLTAGALTSTGNQAISLTTDALTLNGVVSTTGDLLVQPRTPGRNIGLDVTVGGLDLTGLTFTNLFGAGGFDSITVGRADGSGVLTVGGGGIGFADATTLRSPMGEIVVDSQIQLGGTAPLTLAAQTVRARTNIYTTDGDLTVDGRTVIEADNAEIGALGFGGASKTVTVGPIDSASGENFAVGGNAATTVVLTGDIGASGAAGLVTLASQEGVEIGAPSVAITASGLSVFDAIDSVSGQTNALSITMLGGGVAQLGGPIGGATLGDAATLSSLTINGAANLGGGVVQTTGGQTYTGQISLGVDTTFQAESGAAAFSGGMAAAGQNVDIDGGAALAGGTFTATTLDFLGATTVENAVTIDGGMVRFASTLDGASAGAGDLTLQSMARFEGRIGDSTTLGALRLAGAEVATDLIDVNTLDLGGNVSFEPGLVTIDGTGVRVVSDSTLLTTTGASLIVNLTIDGPANLTLDGFALATLRGDIGQTTALAGLEVTDAVRLEMDTIAAGTIDFQGAATIAETLVRISGADVRFGSTVDSVAGDANSLAVDATGTTRFDGVVGSGAGMLGALTSGAGGVTVLNGASLGVDSLVFNDAVQIDASIVTINGSAANFNGALGSAAGESNDLTINGATTRFGGVVSGLDAVTTDAAGSTTIATPSFSAASVNFLDSVTLAAPTVTISGGTINFDRSVLAQSAGGSSLIVNAGTTRFGGAIGAGGRLNTVTTNAAGTTTIGGDQVLADQITFNDTVVVDADALTLDAGVVTLAGMNAGGGDANLTINANTLTINGALGAGSALGSLTTDSAGTTTINGSVATTGGQTYNDTVALAGAVDGASVQFVGDVEVGAGASASATGAVAFDGAVGGGGDLTVSAATIDFAQAIGAMNILGSLQVSGETTLNGGSVTTSGGQEFNGDLRLASDTTFNGQDVRIIGTLRSSDGAAERMVVINDSGDTILSGDFADISELRTDEGGTTGLSGDLVAGDFLFSDDVVLVGDTRIEATGDAGIAFLGRIDSDSMASPRSLTLQTDRNVIADIEANLAPGETLEDALRERLLVEQRPLPTITFGDDVGGFSPLAELRLNVEGSRSEPAIYATIAGVRRIDNGRVSVTTPLNLTINADRFEMGRNEKFTVLGGLTINAGSEAKIGDLTVAQTLRVNVDPAGQIVILAREVGELLAPAEQEQDVIGLVDGDEVLDRVDIVAGGQVLFSKAAMLDIGGVMVETPGGVISGTNGSSGNVLAGEDILFRIFPRSPIALEDLVLRFEDGEVLGNGQGMGGGQPLLFGPGVVDVILDFSSDGLTLASTSGLEGVTGIFAETAAGAVEDEVLLSQSVRDRLERVGLSARDPMMSEITSALAGRAVYNDYASEATASDSGVGYAGEIVVTRLPRGAAEALVAQFESLVGPDDERLNAFKAALADAYLSYFETAPDEMLDDERLLAAGFATRVRSTEPGSEVDEGLAGVAQLLAQIEDLGVTQFEYEAAMQAVLRTFTPDPEMTANEFRIIVDWYKDRLSVERASGPAAAQQSEGASS